MLPPKGLADQLPPIGRHQELDGRRIYLHQAGAGRPPVVFLPGAGAFGLSYYNLHRRAAELTASVIYDRGGTGWSDPVELPRSLATVVDELRRLLRAVDLPSPYLLVGHSLGGLYARRFAQLFPGEVAGLVLLDPAHEDYDTYLSDAVRKFQDGWKNQPPPEFGPEQLAAFRPILAAMYAEWPAEVRDALIARHLDPERFPNGMKEASNVAQLYDEVRAGGPVPPVPLIVYTAVGIDAAQTILTPEDIVRGQNEAKLASNSGFVRSVPGAESRVVDAGHVTIHIQREDEVFQGIRDVLARIEQPVGT